MTVLISPAALGFPLGGLGANRPRRATMLQRGRLRITPAPHLELILDDSTVAPDRDNEGVQEKLLFFTNFDV